MPAAAFTVPRGVYELPLVPADVAGAPEEERPADPLRDAFVVDNVGWFTRLRWIAISALVALGLIGLLPRSVLSPLGVRPRSDWPFVIAALLLLANLFFATQARSLRRRARPQSARLNLWSQIVFDLCLLTVVVHFLGSVETFAPFFFLIHVVLACIFFSRYQSLGVTALACVLYLACVGLERTGALSPASIFLGAALRSPAPLPFVGWLLHVLSAVAIWLLVWHLASHLSAMVRGREQELARTNRQLLVMQEERTRHMLRTTHELKAPFAAIHANTQLLLRRELPEDVVAILRRIAARCRGLAQEIQEMLQLANLQSSQLPPRVDVDLAELGRWTIAHIGAAVRERRVSFEEHLEPARAVGVEDHLKMLFVNVLANAVAYSREGGTVRVWTRLEDNGIPVVTVEDDGIGIAEDKLPRIFDDYYRTDEAVRHNKGSTGLGLAIVRHVAQAHRVRVIVESAPDKGTRVTLRFPRGQENGHGIHPGRRR